MSNVSPQGIQLVVSGVFAGLQTTVDTTPLFEITTDINGVIGSRFYGPQRYSKRKNCLRDNERQWSAIHGNDLRAIVIGWNALLKNAGSHARIKQICPEWLGPNVAFEGPLNDFSLLPAGTELHFSQGPIFVVAEENDPCQNAADFIASCHPGQDVLPAKFIEAAMHLRGLVGTIQKGGPIRVGDLCEVIIQN